MSLDESRIEDVPQLTAVENDILAAPFSEKEVFEAISQMKNNKAPGPDGFPAEFYKKCWHIIKGDLYRCNLIYSLGASTISPEFWNDNPTS